MVACEEAVDSFIGRVSGDDDDDDDDDNDDDDAQRAYVIRVVIS